MQAFRDGKVRALIATDVAARGLDVKGVDLVIQTQPPADRKKGFYSSDASKSGYGIMYKLAGRELAGAVGRVSERSRYKLGAGAARTIIPSCSPSP